MKTRIFLGMGLLFSAIGFGQTTYYATSPGVAGTGGTNDVHVGANAGTSVSTGGQNVFVGYSAGTVNNDSLNVFIGAKAGDLNEASENTFIGYSSGRGNTEGSKNVFNGCGSGRFSSGSFNSFIGNDAGKYSKGSHNVYSGANAGVHNEYGSYNVIIGYNAGPHSSGDKNVLIGNNVGNDATGNQLYIHNENVSNPLIYGEFDNNILKFNAQKVGIGFESTLPDTAVGNEGFGDFPNISGLSNYEIYRLFVNGGILAKEIRVRLDVWADYVFNKDYNLLSLKDTEKYIAENGHLPNMPSAQQVKEEGLEFGNIARLQQEKIEELTLHLIEQQKQIEKLKAQVQLLLNK